MGNIGGGEILVILLLALIVLGPDKLPDVARQVGKAVGEMRKISSGFQREIQDAIRVADEPKPAPVPASATDAAPPETFLPTEPAALTDTELAETATSTTATSSAETATSSAETSDQSVESAATNEPGESAPPVADDVPTMIDTADTFLTTEPDALTETTPENAPGAEHAPVRASTSYPGVVTPPEAPPLPTDVALGGDR